jgi:hypothetical protein
MSSAVSGSRKRRLWSKFCLAILLLLSAIGACSGLNGAITRFDGFPPPWRQRVVSVSLSRGQTIPKIDHGYILFARHIIIGRSQQEAIYLQSLADDAVRRPSFWLKDASIVWVNDSAVSSSNEFFVVGSFARSADGATINFMTESDVEGHVHATIDMGTYEPELACVAPDGSIWTFGQDWSAERSDIPYPMLRNYSSKGRLLGSYLPSESLPPARLNFSTRLHRMGGARGRMFLQCGQQSVGAYIGPVSAWVEIDLASRTTEVWQVEPPSRSIMTGFALLAKHEVYCSYAARNSVFVRGIFKLNLNQSTIATWEPIPGMVDYVSAAPDSAPAMTVIGADGPSLVYQKIESKRHIFFWVRP